MVTSRTLCILLLSFSAAGLAAQAHDGVWLGGTNAFPGAPGYGHFQISFVDSAEVQAATPLAFDFNAAVACFSDEKGELLFYSNGCAVANAAGKILENGEGLNPGSLYDLVCPNEGYIAPQSMLALPWPGHTGEFCLLHLGIEPEGPGQWYYSRLYFSRIDMLANSGVGAVIEKNQVLASGVLGPCAAVRHGNGRDWWIIAPEANSNRYNLYLLNPDELTLHSVVQAGTAPPCPGNGSLVFSPDGQLLARWTGCRIDVLDFDRCAGILNPGRQIDTPGKLLPGGGLAFSPSGRFLYATSYSTLFRSDLSTPAPQLDTLFFAYDPSNQDIRRLNGVSFQYMQLAPDHRIYISTPGRATWYHVIDFPDAAVPGNIGFRATGLELPAKAVRTLPQYPNYRLFDVAGSVCDSLGIDPPTGVRPAVLQPQPVVRMQPNPASDYVHFIRTEAANCDFIVQLTDQTGRQLYTGSWPAAQEIWSIQSLNPGLYFALISGCDKSAQVFKVIIH